MGREANKKSRFPGTLDIGTDAAQAEEAAGDEGARQ
jgi:hypothetical protein